MTPAWLARYTLPDSSGPVWEHVHNHAGYSLATDGATMLAVRGEGGRPLELLPPRSYHGIDRVLTEPAPRHALVTTLGDLWLWLDAFHIDRCPGCAGLSANPADERLRVAATWPFCDSCECRGWVVPEPTPVDRHTVNVCRRLLDGNRLVWWLAGELGEPDDAVRVWPCSTAIVPGVTFAGDEWRVSIAGLNRDVHRRNYRRYYPGAGVWWSQRRCPSARLAAFDWFRDRGTRPKNLFTGAK